MGFIVFVSESRLFKRGNSTNWWLQYMLRLWSVQILWAGGFQASRLSTGISTENSRNLSGFATALTLYIHVCIGILHPVSTVLGEGARHENSFGLVLTTTALHPLKCVVLLAHTGACVRHLHYVSFAKVLSLCWSMFHYWSGYSVGAQSVRGISSHSL